METIRAQAGDTLELLVFRHYGKQDHETLTAVMDANVELPQADQTQESDMHFLSRLARDVGASFKITDGRLIFVARRSGNVASGAGKIS
ncbi:MAG: hypothetical protein AAFQ50_16825, partial [Pseudomonadota bacterium]